MIKENEELFITWLLGEIARDENYESMCYKNENHEQAAAAHESVVSHRQTLEKFKELREHK